MAKAVVDHRNSFTSPTRLASHPVIGMEMALATPNEVMTQVPWPSDEPRLPAMVGIATLAIVESSTCMNVASDSAMVMMTSCAPSTVLLLHYTHPEFSTISQPIAICPRWLSISCLLFKRAQRHHGTGG